ncbi:hypothetical protein ABT299_05865 [Spirillospora sp. NPDC000708]
MPPALLQPCDTPNTTRHYDAAENVPIKGVVSDGWLEAVVDADGIIVRACYELGVIVSLIRIRSCL